MDYISAFLNSTKELINEKGVNYSPSILFNIFTILREAHDEVNLEEVQVIIEEFIEKATLKRGTS